MHKKSAVAVTFSNELKHTLQVTNSFAPNMM